jgi:hypothetical protein
MARIPIFPKSVKLMQAIFHVTIRHNTEEEAVASGARIRYAEGIRMRIGQGGLRMSEDRDAEMAGYRRIQEWVDDAYEDWKSKGGLDDLPGKGKPLTVPEGDVLETIMKNAGVKPPWLMLKQEAKAMMERALFLLERTPNAAEIDELLRDLNKHIEEMNAQAPSLTLHRRKVSRSTLREQYERW